MRNHLRENDEGGRTGRGARLEDLREQEEQLFPICLSNAKNEEEGNGEEGDEEGSSRRERTRGRQEEASSRIHSGESLKVNRLSVSPHRTQICEKLFSISVVCGCHSFGHSSADQFQCAAEGPKVWRC